MYNILDEVESPPLAQTAAWALALVIGVEFCGEMNVVPCHYAAQ
jgi:hypothetical protein